MAQPNLAGPCRDSWEPVYECPLPISSAAVTGVALEAATDVLWALSGRQFGLCRKLLRPCRRECFEESWGTYGGRYATTAGFTGARWPYPALVGGEWFNLACGGCTGTCSCVKVHEAKLPAGLYSVEEVKIDGVILIPGTDYRIDANSLLVRLDGEDWPLCNNLNLDDDQVGTWSVEVLTGQPLPPLGRVALGVLAAEFTKALMCDSTCALPKPVQSISRQGINITFLDPQQVFQNGQTGLYMPDLFIQTVNPQRRNRRAKVYDLDRPPRLVNTPSVT